MLVYLIEFVNKGGLHFRVVAKVKNNRDLIKKVKKLDIKVLRSITQLENEED